MDVICKPIDSWPGEYTSRRKRSLFSAGHTATMAVLRTELLRLKADTVVLEIDISPYDLRNDGWPYAGIKVPPPVKLSFNSKHGPLVYATDVFDHWHDNIRAIALGLEALRKVDRYGITDAGQQYAGWKQLEAAPSLSSFEAVEVLEKVSDRRLDENPDLSMKSLVRLAKLRAHPDHGGSTELLEQVLLAEKVLT